MNWLLTISLILIVWKIGVKHGMSINEVAPHARFSSYQSEDKTFFSAEGSWKVISSEEEDKQNFYRISSAEVHCLKDLGFCENIEVGIGDWGTVSGRGLSPVRWDMYDITRWDNQYIEAEQKGTLVSNFLTIDLVMNKIIDRTPAHEFLGHHIDPDERQLVDLTIMNSKGK